MVDIVKVFGWNYVSIFVDEGDYGVKGIGVFRERFIDVGRCVLYMFKLLCV